jgi:hypothetical protein
MPTRLARRVPSALPSLARRVGISSIDSDSLRSLRYHFRERNRLGSLLLDGDFQRDSVSLENVIGLIIIEAQGRPKLMLRNLVLPVKLDKEGLPCLAIEVRPSLEASCSMSRGISKVIVTVTPLDVVLAY